MKQYKLLKDLPTFKAGDEFYIDSNNNLRLKVSDSMAYNHYALEKFPNILKDWFEEIPEKHERWRGGRGDDYYFINDEGVICHEIDTNDGMDNYRYNVGIYGRTKQELEDKLEYNIARQVLLDDAEGGKLVPGSSNNWYNSYCLCLEEWSTFSTWYYYPGAIYFKSEEALLKSLKEHKDQWEIVRKYEMGEM